MVLRLAWHCVRPTAANETGPNTSDFELTKAHGALLGAAHGANALRQARRAAYAGINGRRKPASPARSGSAPSCLSLSYTGQPINQRTAEHNDECATCSQGRHLITIIIPEVNIHFLACIHK